MANKKKKVDTRAIGLDIGLAFSRFLTGKENLHYGLWDPKWDVCAENLGRAQEAYTAKLFKLLPKGRGLRILDIGGGAGETAKKLLALGHQVDIVIPSAFLAGRCRENAPAAHVHECMFEDFKTEKTFDICLFSESFQYIPLDQSLGKSQGLLAAGGSVIIADCFRTDAFYAEKAASALVGGGHALSQFRPALEASGLAVVSEEDITTAVAPSVDVEQALFNVLGHALTRVDHGISDGSPLLRKTLHKLVQLFINKRTRDRLDQRLNHTDRNAQNFCRYNTYLMMKLAPRNS